MIDTPPLHLRKLRADMELKNLSLRDVSNRSRVPYNTVSMILNGRHVNAAYLQRIRQAIKSAPCPQEPVAA